VNQIKFSYKIKIESVLWFSTMFLAGFSQIGLGPFKPSQIFTLCLLVFLFYNNGVKYSLIFLILVFFSLYGFILGGFQKLDQMIVNVVLFFSIFTFKDRIVKLNQERIISYLKYFNLGLFLSHSIAFLFLILPSMRELVVDTSSIGIRFKGFFNQANGYAFICLISTPISMFFLKRERNFLNLFIVVINLLALVFTQSRGAIFSLTLGFVVVYLSGIMIQGKIFKIIKPIFFSIGLIFIFFVTVPEFLSEKLGINLARLNPTEKRDHERNFGDISIESLQGDRYYLISAGLFTLGKYPFGLGYQDHHTVIGNLTGVYLIPHNYYLTVFLTYGFFFGFIWNMLFLGIIFWGYILFFRNRVSSSSPFYYLLLMMISVSFYYFTHSSDWSYFYIMLSFFAAYLANRNLFIKDEYFNNR
jgi:hypothetical protein